MWLETETIWEVSEPPKTQNKKYKNHSSGEKTEGERYMVRQLLKNSFTLIVFFFDRMCFEKIVSLLRGKLMRRNSESWNRAIKAADLR